MSTSMWFNVCGSEEHTRPDGGHRGENVEQLSGMKRTDRIGSATGARHAGCCGGEAEYETGIVEAAGLESYWSGRPGRKFKVVVK